MRSLLGRWSLPAALLTAGLVIGTLAVPADAADTPTDDPTSSASSATPSDGQAPASSDPAAAEALQEVQQLVAPVPAQARSVEPALTEKARDLTLAIRDLRMRQDDLSAADRARAQRALDLPATNACRAFVRGTTRVAVHYATTGTNASTSGWVDTVGGTALDVLSRYAAAGYRAPESDGTDGNTTGCATGSYLDIYLTDLGAKRLYGYCDTDNPPPSRGPYDTTAYCAFDNNYTEFPGQTPVDNLRVTAAHEIFHAVQFAYDYYEDAWFMESTATWAEDEVYPSINDNLQYLAFGPSKRPATPIDSASAFNGLHVYGSWLFFRYLSEKFPTKAGGMPVVIRRLWTRADGAAGGHDAYSLKAINEELTSHKAVFRKFLARFAEANRHPKRSYREGRLYPGSKAAAAVKLSRTHRDSHWRSIKRNHLTSGIIAVTPASGLKAGWRLRVDVNLPDASRGSAAMVTAYGRNGKIATKFVTISRHGNGHTTLGFDARKIVRVDVTLSNAGNHYDCWEGTAFSCRGKSLDDHRTLAYRVRAVR